MISKTPTPKKQTLKSRIKNFFNVDIEKDLQEEEPTKKFERVKLFKLTRKNLFIGLSLFLLIVNLFVGFDLNFLYLRQILGFLFLIAVPGLLIMLSFKVRVKFWEYLVYTIGLSVAFIMFAGLAVNWTLPLLNITDKPLSLYPILICFDIFLIALGIVAWKRNKGLVHEFTTPKLDTLNRIFFIIPMLFPVLSILGAFILNNHGPNFFTMIMLGGIAVYVLMLVIFRKKLNENVWPWSLYLMGLALLLMFSMRSWYISGTDINMEFYVFNLSQTKGLWNMSFLRHAYNSCLSLTILPTILNNFINIDSGYIYKLIYQFIGALTPLGVYLITKKYLYKYAFVSAFFFISYPSFLSIMPMHLRTEIALLFFTLTLLILFNKEINPSLKKVLFVIFGASMIISHYSTAYIALAIFTLAYIFTLIYKIYENKKIKKRGLHPSQKPKFYLTGLMILFLLIFAFLWYAQITPTGNGLTNFAKDSLQNMGKIFTDEATTVGQSPLNQLNPFYHPPNNAEIIHEFVTDSQERYNFTLNSIPEGAYPQASIEKISKYNLSIPAIQIIYFLINFLNKLIKIFIFLGVIYILYFSINKKKFNLEYSLCSLVSFVLLLMIIMIPYASLEYSLERLYQQTLVLLSLSAVIGGLLILGKLTKKRKEIFLAILFILFFLFSINFIPQIIGGVYSTMSLNNGGPDYNRLFSFKEEVTSAKWLSNNNFINLMIASDRSGTDKLIGFGDNLISYNNDLLFPWIVKDKYFYLTTINSKYEAGYLWTNGVVIKFKVPLNFLKSNTNKIYNNGGSEIFK